MNLFLAAIIIPLSTGLAVYGMRTAWTGGVRPAFGISLLIISLRKWIDLLSGADGRGGPDP